MCERMEEVFGSISSRRTALEARPMGCPGDAAAAHVAGTPSGNASERSREQRPEHASSPHEKEVMKDLKALPGEAWSYAKAAEQVVLPHAVDCHGLRKAIVILASSLELWPQDLHVHGAGEKGPASVAGMRPAGAVNHLSCQHSRGVARDDDKLRAEVE